MGFGRVTSEADEKMENLLLRVSGRKCVRGPEHFTYDRNTKDRSTGCRGNQNLKPYLRHWVGPSVVGAALIRSECWGLALAPCAHNR
jgi:hypothetical protein